MTNPLAMALAGCKRLPKDEAQAAIKHVKNAWMGAMLAPENKDLWLPIFGALNSVMASVALKQGLFGKHNKKVLDELEADIEQLAQTGQGKWAAVEGVLEAYEALVSRASLAQLYNIEQYVLDRKKKGNVTWI